jgi:hypothetical protein
MPIPDASISWLGSLGWLLVITAAGFLVTWLLTNRLGMRRIPYIAALALLTGGLTWGYLSWSDTDLSGFLTNRWGWGLVGAAVRRGRGTAAPADPGRSRSPRRPPGR